MSKTAPARVVNKVSLSTEICAVTFEATEERFANLEPGAHLSVHLAGDIVRSYSLTDWDENGRWASVAVKHEPQGRGGSIAMHALQIGDVVSIDAPRNNFPLRNDGKRIVLIGGGIGMTPLYAMARVLQRDGQAFDAYYVVRNRDQAALDGRLRELNLGARYRLRCTDVDGRPDFSQILEDHPADAHYYVCGPESMLGAIMQASKSAARGQVFFERFTATADAGSGRNEPFQVVLKSTGDEYTVPADNTVLRVLRDAGHNLDHGCTEGVCGSCITDVLDGEIDHRDSVLSEEERAQGDCMTICVSRARFSRLVLDL